ncbi:L-cysteate sulfo-lyase [Posidoniimonas polymericola]|uniref:L-cysteate sulfo-lyase n=1 Tax=Posidoniimonas polymericola TaxID=2528002 RepID=A0A5C5YM95_9BACT|nr:D-cysteine desulfhydrase family protein [Posidoniimonas polymericola]TWT75975.1 L-cysteate sulfo-lyase [Posidoniimonas polymericola]
MTDRLPRVSLANLPTPLHRLTRLSAQLGVDLWIKRDDLTSLATGGNKTRKLEYLIADALARGADCVVTAGGPQSNHCRQTAAAAAQHGLACCLVLGGEPQPPLGNLLLDRLLGAEVHWTPKPNRKSRMQELAGELGAAGRTPYVIPIGGSNAIGAVGYVAAMDELLGQAEEAGVAFDRVVFPTSSGGTHAGLALGAKRAGFGGVVTAISIDAAPTDHAFLEEVAQVATEAAGMLGDSVLISPAELEVEYGYLGGGYGVVGDTERDAIRLMGRQEGILLGPVYSGRGFGALLDMIAQGKVAAGQRVLYWHTGDESALHAYADELLEGDVG